MSADSHPVSGAFVFHVGKPGAGAAGVASQVLEDQGGSRAVDRSFDVVRFLNFAFILLCVGGAGVLALVLRAEAVIAQAAVGGACGDRVLLAVVTVAGIGLEGANASGLGLDAAFRTALIGDVLETQFGRVWLVRAVLAIAVAGLAALALLRPRRGEHAVALVACGLGAGIAVTPALSGHARVPGLLAVFSDWVHVLAASAWIGGLVFVLVALWRAGLERWSLAARAVPRFSALAVVSVTALLVAGVVGGFLEVRSWSALWETTYGQLLLVKVALVLPVLALGWFNNRVSVPRLRAGIASAVERRRFRRSAGAELALVVVIIGVTAVLVAEPPARAQIAAQTGPVSREAFLVRSTWSSSSTRPGRGRTTFICICSTTRQVSPQTWTRSVSAPRCRQPGLARSAFGRCRPVRGAPSSRRRPSRSSATGGCASMCGRATSTSGAPV